MDPQMVIDVSDTLKFLKYIYTSVQHKKKLREQIKKFTEKKFGPGKFETTVDVSEAQVDELLQDMHFGKYM